MPYISLAPVKLTAAADQTGANPGNWSNSFMAASMPLVNPQYEIYHMTVVGGAPLAGGVIYVGLTNPWSTVQLDINGTNEWDPSEPLLLTSGQEIYVLWDTPDTDGNPPVVTIWPRYDPTISGAG